jgi:hypothetical protein
MARLKELARNTGPFPHLRLGWSRRHSRGLCHAVRRSTSSLWLIGATELSKINRNKARRRLPAQRVVLPLPFVGMPPASKRIHGSRVSQMKNVLGSRTQPQYRDRIGRVSRVSLGKKSRIGVRGQRSAVRSERWNYGVAGGTIGPGFPAARCIGHESAGGH